MADINNDLHKLLSSEEVRILQSSRGHVLCIPVSEDYVIVCAFPSPSRLLLHCSVIPSAGWAGLGWAGRSQWSGDSRDSSPGLLPVPLTLSALGCAGDVVRCCVQLACFLYDFICIEDAALSGRKI